MLVEKVLQDYIITMCTWAFDSQHRILQSFSGSAVSCRSLVRKSTRLRRCMWAVPEMQLRTGTEELLPNAAPTVNYKIDHKSGNALLEKGISMIISGEETYLKILFHGKIVTSAICQTNATATHSWLALLTNVYST